MVHPAATTGKTVHSLEDIFDSLVALIERKYNADAEYRDPELPPLKEVYYGEPAVIMGTPAVAVKLVNARYEDAPQNAGADIESEWVIICYGREHGAKPQQKESIRMAEIIRHIILDNTHLSTASGTEQVFQANYGEMEIEFDEYVKSNMDDLIGVQIAVIKFTAVFAELGY